MIEVYKIALGEYGTQEWAGDKHNQEVLKYFLECGFPEIKTDETSWCSAFVCWCVKQAGLQHTGSLAARSWLNWGVPVYNPEIGDVTIFYRNDPKGWEGHVGLFTRQDGAKIWVLGGNQSNRVCIDHYPGLQLLGYRRNK